VGKSKKTKDEFVNTWMEQIRYGIRYRKEYSTFTQWDDHRKYYRGQWETGIIPINKIFSNGRTLVPKVYFRAPRVTVTATHPRLVVFAKIVEALDNMLIQQVMLKGSLKMAALDSYLCGVGPIKLGYDSEFGYIPEQSISPSGETVTQHSTTEEGERIEYCDTIKPGMPWALRVRPDDVIVPWGSTDPNSVPWIAHYILRPLDDIKQDQKYKNTDKLQGTRTPMMGNDVKTRAPYRPRTDKDNGTTYAELWEVRDRKTQQLMVFCEDQLLMSVADALQTPEGMPWEFIAFNPDPEYFWAIPDAAIILPQQIELNDINTQASQHRAIALIKFLIKEGALTKDQISNFLSGVVGPAVMVNAEETLASAVEILQPHIPPELERSAQAQMAAMREQLGVGHNQEGMFSPYHGKTASESMIVAEASGERVDERKDMLGDTLIRIVKKWNWFLFNFWTEERVIKIVAPNGEVGWHTFTGDQLKGEYVMDINYDSGMPVSRALKQQMTGEMFKVLAGDQMIDQVMLRQIVLDQFSSIDPRIPHLIQPQFGGTPELLSAQRQPTPIHSGAGRGSSGGRTASTPNNPVNAPTAKPQVG